MSYGKYVILCPVCGLSRQRRQTPTPGPAHPACSRKMQQELGVTRKANNNQARYSNERTLAFFSGLGA